MEEASVVCIQVRREVGLDEVGGGGPSQSVAFPHGPACLDNHRDECRVAGGWLSVTWPICIHRPYVGPAIGPVIAAGTQGRAAVQGSMGPSA